MLRVFDPLVNRRTYAGWVFALLGALCWLPAGVVGLVALLPGWPRGAQAAIFGVVAVVAVAALGLPARSREGCVWLANRLLGAALPSPARRPLWSSRARTALWLVAHAVVGGTLVAVGGLLLGGALVLSAVWLNGGGTLTFLTAGVTIAPDSGGLWTLVVSLASLPLAVYLTAGATAGLRWLATRLLGPDAAEKLAVVAERADELARRNRLAQELHDSIGHTLTTSTIQAAVANQLMDSDPDEARRAMSTIEESSRHALDDLDHVLGVLRQDGGTREPERTLADLEPLLDRVAATGTPVHRRLDERVATVPATVSRAAFRVVQEAVTNALRHAPDEPLDVTVAIVGGELRLEVTNPLPTAPSDRGSTAARRSGRGLAGTAERVRLLHGEVTAGADEDGTHWVLSARLPLPQ